MLSSWQEVKGKFEELLKEGISSESGFLNWIYQVNQLKEEILEEAAWKYIRLSRKTNSKEYQEDYERYKKEVEPHIREAFHKIERKILEEGRKYAPNERRWELLLKRIERGIKIFREENLPLIAKEQVTAQKYNAIVGALEIEYQGKKYTLPKARKFLESPNREERKEVYEKIAEKRLEKKQEIFAILEELLDLRRKIAQNAGFSSYIPYRFEELLREFTLADCISFHEGVKNAILPYVEKTYKIRKEALKLSKLRPWDLSVNFFAEEKPLHPFSSLEEWIEKTADALGSLKKEYKNYFLTLYEKGYLDLESRPHKAPGGYNYSLPKSKLSFIFMNASSRHDDILTLFHEIGHALHGYFMREIDLVDFRDTPSEVSEVASMGMELLSMPYWSYFYSSRDHDRAQIEQMERILTLFPWVSAIDTFQQEIYSLEKPPQEKEVEEIWLRVYRSFRGEEIDYSGYEDIERILYQGQLHIFEVPFYYIEYGIAQLGALSLWKRKEEEGLEKTLELYENFLKIGYQEEVKKIYQKAEIPFSWEKRYFSSLGEKAFSYLQELYLRNI